MLAATSWCWEPSSGEATSLATSYRGRRRRGSISQAGFDRLRRVSSFKVDGHKFAAPVSNLFSREARPRRTQKTLAIGCLVAKIHSDSNTTCLRDTTQRFRPQQCYQVANQRYLSELVSGKVSEPAVVLDRFRSPIFRRRSISAFTCYVLLTERHHLWRFSVCCHRPRNANVSSLRRNHRFRCHSETYPSQDLRQASHVGTCPTLPPRESTH